jgi:hypothetical protein
VTCRIGALKPRGAFGSDRNDRESIAKFKYEPVIVRPEEEAMRGR